MFEDEGVAELGPVGGAGLDEEAVPLLSGGFSGVNGCSVTKKS